MTYRAVVVLKDVAHILAEDTRNSGRLLKHFEIETPMRSYHAHNEHRSVDRIIEELTTGIDIALITDAGTPAISDPGFLLVRACHEHDIPVTCLPGATALIPALASSGIPCDRFHFEGFLPHKKGRQTRWKYLAELEHTIALYESPHRIKKCVKEVGEYLGTDRDVSVIKVISKVYETIYKGSAEAVLATLEALPSIKGEFVVVIKHSSKVGK
jgi:16S rRNA (cytidine1402-2'-O)-methyltransferase